MPTVTGKSEVKAYFAAAPERVRALLRGAGRAAGKVIADEVKARSISPEVSEAVTMKTKAEDGRISVLITVKPGWAHSVGMWLEYGTKPHFISVDDSQRNGMSVRKVNEAHKGGSLVIGGQFVGATVFHPGARPHPFMRPALDTKEGEAIAAAQDYINTRVRRGDISAPDEPETNDA